MEREILAIEQLIIYADASQQLADNYRALLKKIWDRANPSIIEDNAQTRLDPDLMDELERLFDETTS